MKHAEFPVGMAFALSLSHRMLNMDFANMRDNFRLSRVSHPRTSLAAIMLLLAVFVAFGVFADQALPTKAAANRAGADIEINSVWLDMQSRFDLWTR